MSIVKGQMSNVSFAFFGTPELSVEILKHLKQTGLLPALIITNPDRPQGRKMIITPPPVKLWAIANKISFLQPENLSDQVFLDQLSKINCQLFIVVAYGKIIPKAVLDIPEKGTLNIHYSLLPKYRGASPIETAILNDDKNTGVSILLLDEKMDHGPIVAEQPIQDSKFKIQEWPITARELRNACNLLGAELLTETIPLWVEGKIKAKEQDHLKATYAPKIAKEDGLIDLNGEPYKNFLKFQAYKDWPGTYFLAEKNSKKIRVIIKNAIFKDGKLEILSVVPEGKKEINYNDFLKGCAK